MFIKGNLFVLHINKYIEYI